MKGRTVLKAWNDFRAQSGCGDDEMIQTAFYAGAGWAAFRIDSAVNQIANDVIARINRDAAASLKTSDSLEHD